MSAKKNLGYLKKNFYHANETFINGKNGQLIVEPLAVFKPKNITEFNEIQQYCKTTEMKFKLVKGSKSQFVNPGYNNDFLVIDVNCLDSILQFDDGHIKHYPGTTASQLNQYLDNINIGYQLPLSVELTDPLLVYYHQNKDLMAAHLLLEYDLIKHQNDTRCLVIGLKSFEDLYKSYHEIILLKEEIGSLIRSFFYVNKEAMLICQNSLNKAKFIHSEKLFTNSGLKKCGWFLLIEFYYNKHIYQGINKVINERLHGLTRLGYNIFDRLKIQFNKGSLRSRSLTKNSNHEYYCETLSVLINNDINLLLFTYHSIYCANLQFNFIPNIFIEMLSNGKIKLSIKIFYKTTIEKQRVLNFMLTIIQQVQLKTRYISDQNDLL